MAKRYFELSDAGSHKFWEVWIDKGSVFTRYGKIGATGATTVKDQGSPEAARTLHAKLVKEKTGKGYVEASGVGSAPKKGVSATAPETKAPPVSALKPKPATASKTKDATVASLVRPVAAIPRTVPVVTQVMPPCDDLRPDLASDGERLLVASNKAVFVLNKRKLAPLVSGQIGVAGLAIRGDEIWVACYGHVLVSRDRGATFTKISLLDSCPFYAIACTAEGVWVAGHEGAAFLSTDGKTFTKLGGLDKATFKRGIASPLGALLLKYNGRLGLGVQGKTKATPLRTKSPLLDACVTASGAILIVGHGDWKGAAYRTEDCVTFTEATLPTASPLQSVACLPDGRVIVGCQEDELLVSYDDGRSFELLPHAFKGAKRNFDVLAVHKEAIYATGSFQGLLEIR